MTEASSVSILAWGLAVMQAEEIPDGMNSGTMEPREIERRIDQLEKYELQMLALSDRDLPEPLKRFRRAARGSDAWARARQDLLDLIEAGFTPEFWARCGIRE